MGKRQHPAVLQTAVSRLVLKFPFYAAIALMSPLEEDDSIPTAGTDGYKIMYNRDFIESLKPHEVMFVLAHEVEHIVRLHAFRKGTRDHMKWNIAADHVINTDLLAMGLKGPEDEHGRFMGMADQQYANTAEELVYRKMSENEDKNKQQGQPQSGGDGSNQPQQGQPQSGDGGSGNSPSQDVFAGDLKQPKGKDGKPMSKAAQGQREREVRGRVLQAAAQVKATKGIGSLPDHLRGMLVELLEPQVDWKDVLRDFVTARCADDYSWSRLNRRVRHRGLRMPTLYSEQVGGIGVIIDTSGSCYAEIPKFLSEVSAIASDAKPVRIFLMFVDTRVQEVVDTTWDNFEADMGDLLSKPPHGGGTDLRAGFQHIEEHAPDLECVVCLTDMWSPWPDDFILGDQTLFVDTDDKGDEPFGRRVVLKGDY